MHNRTNAEFGRCVRFCIDRHSCWPLRDLAGCGSRYLRPVRHPECDRRSREERHDDPRHQPASMAQDRNRRYHHGSCDRWRVVCLSLFRKTGFPQRGRRVGRWRSSVSHLGDIGASGIIGVCPLSDNLRLVRRFEKGGSGSSGLEFMRPAADAASGGLRLSYA